MTKKAYIILGVLLILIVAAGVTLVLLARKGTSTSGAAVATTTKATTTATTSTTPTTSGTASGTSGTSTTSTTATGGGTSGTSGTGPTSSGTSATTDALVRRTTDQVISPILSFQGNQVWYFTSSGNLEELDLTSATLQKYVLPKSLTVSSAIWPSQGSDFIIATNNANGSQTFNYYSSAQKAFTTYPSNVKQVAFIPSGNQVIYVWDNGNGSSSLSIADPSLANHKQLVATLPEPNDTVVVSPLGDHVLLYDPTNPTDNKLYLMALSDLKVHAIKTGPENAAIWSNDGQHFVFDKYNTANPSDTTLYSGSISNSKSDTNLGITVPVSKLAYNATGSVLYYAAPDSSAASAATGNDAAQGQSLTLADSLWSYAFATGSRTEIFPGNTYNLSATNLLVSTDNKTLYFENSDGYLYSVVISK